MEEIPTLKGKLIISGHIKTETGLHIGGISETLKIGGVDIQVIKDSLGRTYIPGSSLKGKIRSLLEVSEGENYDIHIKFYKKENNKDKITREIRIYNKYNQQTGIERKIKIKLNNKKWDEVSEENYNNKKDEIKLKREEYRKEISSLPCSCGGCDICKIFGPHNSKNIIHPRRAIVRDAFLVKKDKNGNEIILTKKDEDYDNYFEVKIENVIDRIKGTAQHPRQIERVVKGQEFKFEIIFNIFNKEKDAELIKKFIKGMKLLEDDYLGGCGSRGYGKVKFEDLKVVYRPKEYYEEENRDYKENRDEKEKKEKPSKNIPNDENKFNDLKTAIDEVLSNDKQN